MNTKKLLPFIPIFLMAAFYSISTNAQNKLSVANIPDSLRSGANAVVRYDETILDFQNTRKMLLSKRFAATVFNKKAEVLLDLFVHYKEGSDKVKNIKVKLLDKDGNELLKSGKNDIKDYIAKEGFEFVSDSRVKYVDNELIELPLTVEYSYTLESNNTIIPRWIPVRAYNISVEKSSFEIKNIEPSTLQKKEQIDFSSCQKLSEISYVCAGFKSLKYEPYSPSLINYVPVVFFNPASFEYEGYEGGFTNWEEYGKWKYDSFLLKSNDLDAEKTKNELDEIIGSETDKLKITKLIYDYVQKQTRYIFIGLDEGGYKPMSSGTVHKYKYGDCKALSFYTKSLLDLYDIPANYVEINAGTSRTAMHDETFASIGQGNHIILNVPMGDSNIWLECTSNDMPSTF